MNTEYKAILIALIAGALFAWRILRTHYRHEFVVNDGFAGLIYRDGKLSKSIAAGRHVYWGRILRMATLDTRNTLMIVAGQDVLSADGVSIKVSAVITANVTDAIKATQTVDNYSTHLYSAAQTAIREVVSGLTMDALINQRFAINSDLRDRLVPVADNIGLKVQAIEVRDLMLSADLRRAFNETLKAKQEGLAALERARGESAALRNLANAARLLENQPALVTLRFRKRWPNRARNRCS